MYADNLRIAKLQHFYTCMIAYILWLCKTQLDSGSIIFYTYFVHYFVIFFSFVLGRWATYCSSYSHRCWFTFFKSTRGLLTPRSMFYGCLWWLLASALLISMLLWVLLVRFHIFGFVMHVAYVVVHTCRVFIIICTELCL